jgi:hypothetical protein
MGGESERGSIFEMVRTPTHFESFCVQFKALVWTPFSLTFFTLMLCMASANWFHLFASLPFCVRETAARPHPALALMSFGRRIRMGMIAPQFGPGEWLA